MDELLSEITPDVMRRLLIEAEAPIYLINIVNDAPPAVVIDVLRYVESVRQLTKHFTDRILTAKRVADEAVTKFSNIERATGQQIKSLTAAVLNSQQQLKEARSTCEIQNQRIVGLQGDLARAQDDLREQTSARRSIKGRAIAWRKRAAVLAKDMQTIADQQKASNKKLLEELNNEKAEVKTSREMVESLKAQLGRTTIERKMSQDVTDWLKAELLTIKSELKECRGKMAQLEAERKAATDTADLLKINLEKATGELAMERKTNRGSADMLKSEFERLTAELKTSRDATQSMEAALAHTRAQLSGKIRTLEAEGETQRAENQSLKSQLDILKPKYENAKKLYFDVQKTNENMSAEINRRDVMVTQLGRQLGSVQKKTRTLVDAATSTELVEEQRNVDVTRYLNSIFKVSQELSNKQKEVDAFSAALKAKDDTLFLLREEVGQIRQQQKLSEKIWLKRLTIETRKRTMQEKAVVRLQNERLKLKKSFYSRLRARLTSSKTSDASAVQKQLQQQQQLTQQPRISLAIRRNAPRLSLSHLGVFDAHECLDTPSPSPCQVSDTRITYQPDQAANKFSNRRWLPDKSAIQKMSSSE